MYNTAALNDNTAAFVLNFRATLHNPTEMLVNHTHSFLSLHCLLNSTIAELTRINNWLSFSQMGTQIIMIIQILFVHLD